MCTYYVYWYFEKLGEYLRKNGDRLKETFLNK